MFLPKCPFVRLLISSFRRVLPLPSESWEEFSGGVFCHYHHRLGDDVEGREVVTPSAFRITPREGDCLYSMSTLLLTEKALDVRRVYKVLMVGVAIHYTLLLCSGAYFTKHPL